MKTFYFNTGVLPYGHNPPIELHTGQVWRNGTVQIPFDCEDVPERAVFMFACDDPNLKEDGNFIVRPIYNSSLCSRFAYFRLFTS